MLKPTKRITGTTLQAIRRAQFEREPLCRRCKAQGIVRIATQSDHIDPLHKGGAESMSNRQSLCDECHKIKTAEDMRWSRKPPRRRTGIDGYPLEVA